MQFIIILWQSWRSRQAWRRLAFVGGAAALGLLFTAGSVAAQPQVEVPPDAPDLPTTALPRETPVETALGGAPAMAGTAIGGYGELTLNAPKVGPSIVDLRRVVLFIGHNFTEHIRFYSEFEVEHAVVSSGDQGEFEIEQAYLDGIFHRHFNLRGGLIIMPVGIVNIYHEPPTFNGVDRPDVDTFVIPSTWREPGFGIFGELAQGLRYQLYFVNGLNANGFSASAGVRGGHQEAQLASARDVGAVARIDYEPVLGTDIGVSGYGATSGNTLHDTVGRVPVGIFELDLRTRWRGFTARAEAALLFIGDAAALNRALAAGSPEQMAAGPVSGQSRGGYVEVGYDVLRVVARGSSQNVTLFARYDYVNTQASVPDGATAQKELVRYTLTAGTVYRPIPQIGLKLDYRRHEFGAGPGFNELCAAITWMF